MEVFFRVNLKLSLNDFYVILDDLAEIKFSDAKINLHKRFFFFLSFCSSMNIHSFLILKHMYMSTCEKNILIHSVFCILYGFTSTRGKSHE